MSRLVYREKKTYNNKGKSVEGEMRKKRRREFGGSKERRSEKTKIKLEGDEARGVGNIRGESDTR